MKRKIEIDTNFEYLKPFVEKIPELFEWQGEDLYEGRNILKVFDVDGLKVVVKRFKIPILINKFAYAYIRASKARRSYTNAQYLISQDIPTPTPIAYVECFYKGLMQYSYYISIHADKYSTSRAFFYESNLSENNTPFFSAFSEFTSSIHQKGIYHLDYSPGNVLFKEESNGYSFCLVDINRMKFITVDAKLGCRNFHRLCCVDHIYRFLGQEYARFRDLDPNFCEDVIIESSAQFLARMDRKRALKRSFKKILSILGFK